MRDRLTRFTQAAGDCVPDATAMAVLLLIVLVVASLGLGNGAVATADAFYRGLWMLLAFSMQMTLLLVLSAVLSRTSLFRTMVLKLARLPRNRGQVVLIAVALNASLSYLYWGLGLALGPLIAVHFARAAEERGIRVDFPCLLATVFAASAVWQFGLSSTPVLMAATPGHFLEATTGILPLATTIGSPAAILMVVTYALAVALARVAHDAAEPAARSRSSPVPGRWSLIRSIPSSTIPNCSPTIQPAISSSSRPSTMACRMFCWRRPGWVSRCWPPAPAAWPICWWTASTASSSIPATRATASAPSSRRRWRPPRNCTTWGKPVARWSPPA